jgi:hypothetical protein
MKYLIQAVWVCVRVRVRVHTHTLTHEHLYNFIIHLIFISKSH